MSRPSEVQPALPFRVDEGVSWVKGEEVKRWGRFGKKIVRHLLHEDGDNFLGYGFARVEMNVAEINTLSDPQLRYALRFQDAANAVGVYLGVTATDEGVHSRLLESVYWVDATTNEHPKDFLDALKYYEPGTYEHLEDY